MQFVAASIYSTLRPPRVYLASWDAVQLPLILALLLQRLFFNQWNVNWDRPENRTAFSRQKKWECLGPSAGAHHFAAPPRVLLSVHGEGGGGED